MRQGTKKVAREPSRNAQGRAQGYGTRLTQAFPILPADVAFWRGPRQSSGYRWLARWRGVIQSLDSLEGFSGRVILRTMEEVMTQLPTAKVLPPAEGTDMPDNWRVVVALPDGREVTIFVPTPGNRFDSHIWDDGAGGRYGLNMVTNGHYG